MTIQILGNLQKLTYEQLKEIEIQGTIVDDTYFNITVSGSKYNIETLGMYLDQEEIIWVEI